MEFIKNTLDRSLVDHLNLDPESADEENKQEMAHVKLNILYIYVNYYILDHLDIDLHASTNSTG